MQMFNVNHPGNVMRILSNIKELQIWTMRRNIAQLLPHIFYSHTNRKYHPPANAKASKTKFLATPDAFDIAIDAVFKKLYTRFPAPKWKAASVAKISFWKCPEEVVDSATLA